MLASWKWLSEFVDLSSFQNSNELAQLLTSRGLEVEKIVDLSNGFEKVVTAKILEKNDHPQADRLSLCKVTTDGKNFLDIVCGAKNMKVGDVVALAQVGAKLPNGSVINESKIRGVISQGMLCSEEELKLKEKSEGILILPENTPIGKPLAKVLNRDDILIEFNLTPNRGDCLSIIGLAREISALSGKPLKKKPYHEPKSGKSPILTACAGSDGPQFLGCLIEGVKTGPSPTWMVERLESIGTRSINNVVDCTNWVLYELGQPTHAYDADQLEGSALKIRYSRENERLLLLDGKEIELTGKELVISDEKKAVALAGVMGGKKSEVTNQTTRVFLECAEFSSVLVRRAALTHQRRTEAAIRFERGIDPQGLSFALFRLAELIQQTAGGKAVGFTYSVTKERGGGFKPKKIVTTPKFLIDFLGVELPSKQVKNYLTALECKVEEKGDIWNVEVPSYRLDLSIPEDLAEEIARSIGYEKLPSTIPVLTTAPSSAYTKVNGVDWEQIEYAKDVFVSLGFVENIQFAFTSRSWLSEWNMSSNLSIQNPLSEEQEVLIPSLIPGLLKSVFLNWNHHFGSEPLSIRLFELRPTFHVSSDSETGVIEKWKLAFVLSGPRYSIGLRDQLGEVDFFDVKAVLESFFEILGTRGVRFASLDSEDQLYHSAQSIKVLGGKDQIGTVGLLHPKFVRKHKTRAQVWLGELDWESIVRLSRSVSQPKTFHTWSEFPPIERDFALLVKDGIKAEAIIQQALKAGRPLAKAVKIFDIYQGKQIAEGMTSLAVRVIFSGEGRSLREEEAEEASLKILAQWKKELGVELRT